MPWPQKMEARVPVESILSAACSLYPPPPIGAWTADGSCATCPGASSTRSEGQGSKQGKWRYIPTRKEVIIKTSIPAAVIVAKGDITCVFFFQRQVYLGQAK